MAIAPLVNDIVDFQLVVNGILGDERKGAVVIAQDLLYSAARLMDPQLQVKHTNLFQYFASAVGNVNDPSAYRYFAVQLANGSMEVIGIPWVNESTFRVVQGRTAIYTINNFEERMRPALAKFLRDLGATYTQTELTSTGTPSP